MKGIYVHVPFCDGKCPYCDFYSVPPVAGCIDKYVEAVTQEMEKTAKRASFETFETVYFGGGTPSQIGADGLIKILESININFNIAENAEITVEVNPSDVSLPFFAQIRRAGFNRLSMGLQSANQKELEILGRKHTASAVEEAVKNARKAGVDNISLDLMIALPGQTAEMLEESMGFAVEHGVEHISAYILKIEKNTEFARQYSTADLPADDEAADLYLHMVQWLKSHGYGQYEISNFAKAGYESRHNLVYWHCEEYLGFGPAAHSFYDGKRFYYPKSLKEFIANPTQVADGEGGDFEEYVMLNLRLSEGLKRERCKTRFKDGDTLFEGVLKNTKKCPHDLIHADSESICLTPKGFAVSNPVILTLLGD